MLVDAQGRVFGRWNIIDVIFFLLIGFVVVCGGIAGARWLFVSTAPLPVKTIEADLVLLDPAHPTPGDSVFDRRHHRIGQVVEASDIRATVRLNVPYKEHVIKLSTFWLGVGSSLKLYTDAGTYRATIEDLSAEPRVWIRGVVRCSGIPQEVALIVKEGDRQTSTHGRVIARISKILSHGVNKIPLSTTGNVVGTQTEYHEVVLALDMLVSQKGEDYFLKDQPLRIGQTVAVDTTVYSISGQLIQLTTLDGRSLLPPDHPTVN